MVSIILATFNRAQLISETLESIKSQRFSNFECIIIDDGSTDNSREVISSYLQDKRFKYYKRPEIYQKGLPGCRNYGLELAIGEYICFCDDDDIVHPEHLEIALSAIKQYDFIHFQKQSFTTEVPSISLIKNWTYLKNIDENSLYEVLTNKIPLASCTVLWSRNAIADNRFEENLHYAEELEFYSRLLANQSQGRAIDSVLYYNRKHPKSNTGEFYGGNIKRRESYIEACKLIINNLNEKSLLTPQIIKYFAWEAYSKSSKILFKHLMAINIAKSEKIRAALYFYFGPFLRRILILKKTVMQ